jgi:hypothetical protein
VCVLVLGLLGFGVFSVGVVVEQTSMVLGIMVSRSLLLLVGGAASTDERLVEPKQLEWLQSGAASWRGGGDGILSECGGGNCCCVVVLQKKVIQPPI